MRKKTIAVFVLVAVLLSCAAAYLILADREAVAAEDEIMLKIKLDLKEDIGLFVIDYYLDGKRGGCGSSNADRSLIKKDDLIYFSFYRGDYADIADTVDLDMSFRIVTEYCEPNYENIYPEELVVPAGCISISADFGGTYHITVTGDKLNGYHAELDDLQDN